MDKYVNIFFYPVGFIITRDRHRRDRMVVAFTTTFAIRTYHH